MERIYCMYYRNINNVYSMNPEIVGYYTDLDIAENHLREIGKLYRKRGFMTHYTSDKQMLVKTSPKNTFATYTIKAHSVNENEILNLVNSEKI